MNNILNDFNNIEQKIARYMYKKYIEGKKTNVNINEFFKTIFEIERRNFTSIDILEKKGIESETNNLSRCVYIREFKNRLYRCKNFIDDDNDEYITTQANNINALSMLDSEDLYSNNIYRCRHHKNIDNIFCEDYKKKISQ